MEENKNNEYDLELQYELRYTIEAKEVIVVDDSKQYVNLILNNYPQGLNKIAWEEVNLLLFKEEDYSDEYWKNKIKEKLYEICKIHSLGHLAFIVIGDNLIDKGYKMTFNVFLEIFWSFFSIPQHTYVISEDGRYCLNYTFEDELYFGKADFVSTVLHKSRSS